VDKECEWCRSSEDLSQEDPLEVLQVHEWPEGNFHGPCYSTYKYNYQGGTLPL
jgi:hypothetical protein